MEPLQVAVLDIETVQEPETVLACLDSLLTRQAALERALSLSVAVLLHHLGEVKVPPEAVYRDTLQLLKEFLDLSIDNQIHERINQQLQDLLESAE